MNRHVKQMVLRMRPVIRWFASLAFEKQYLTGRHFDSSLVGYLWVVKAFWLRNVLRIAPPMPWPVAINCQVSNPKNVIFHPDNLDNFQSSGTYFQNFKAKIYVGRGTYIAQNVGLITANHRLGNLDEHEDGRDIVLGDRCWIGMNSVVLPGVVLGADTVVAAGSVVTKSFPQGRVVIGGVPAKILKVLDELAAPMIENASG